MENSIDSTCGMKSRWRKGAEGNEEKGEQQEIFAAIIKEFTTIKSFFCFMRFSQPSENLKILLRLLHWFCTKWFCFVCWVMKGRGHSVESVGNVVDIRDPLEAQR